MTTMESSDKGNRETSPLLNPRQTGVYSRSLSEEEAILGVSNNYSRFHHRYRLYGRRWYVLLVLYVLNVSNAMLWLSFAPIADLAALYYEQSLDAINWLSIVFLICYLLFGLPTMWILDVLGLRTGIILGAWLNGIGAAIRILSGTKFVAQDFRFLVVMIGQTLAALAQPFLLCAPTKLAGVWFGSNERGTANMIASLSNPVGVMIANVLAPLFVTKQAKIPLMLKLFSIPALLGITMATFGVCSSTPPTPPTASAEAKSEPFFLGLRKVLRNKAFLILMVAFGSGVGLFTCLTTLLEQIICPRGYDDKLAGVAGAALIAIGLAGGALSGFYIDKTKKFEEAAKMSYGCATISCCVLTIVTSFSGLRVLLICSCGLFGFFAFALMPVCLEVGVECTYPVAEATSAGLQWMAGQGTGIVFILICQVLEVPKTSTDSKCLKKTKDGEVADFQFAMYFMSAAAVAMAILLICTFKPAYKRLEMELKKEATRILNTETSPERLPDIHDSSSDISR